MELIDKKGKINKTTFKQIIKEACTAHLGIVVGKTEVNTVPEQLLLDLFCLDIPNDKDVEVRIENNMNNKAYVFTGKDFNWFLKDDRLTDLSKYVYGYDIFADDAEEQKQQIAENAENAKKTKTIRTLKPVELLDFSDHHVATVCTKEDIEDPVINDFVGKKYDCVKWLNQQIVKCATLENEVEILICLDYDAEEPEWKTLKELFDEGKIEIS